MPETDGLKPTETAGHLPRTLDRPNHRNYLDCHPSRRLPDTAKSDRHLQMLRRLLVHPAKQRAFQQKRDRQR